VVNGMDGPKTKEWLFVSRLQTVRYSYIYSELPQLEMARTIYRLRFARSSDSSIQKQNLGCIFFIPDFNFEDGNSYT